jgi:hypothetical protein
MCVLIGYVKLYAFNTALEQMPGAGSQSNHVHGGLEVDRK